MIQVLLSTLQQRKKFDEVLKGVKCWIFSFSFLFFSFFLSVVCFIISI
jgi:hypothetical protein